VINISFFFLPGRNLAITLPITLVAGFIVGLLVDTGPMKSLILPVTILMIYPTMIGFRVSELVNLSHTRLLAVSLIINFILIPLIAYLLGSIFLRSDYQMFAGLIIAALLPTSNMTIAFTMISKGNVPAAIKLTVLSLVVGSMIAPWYLLAMLGKYIPIDVVATLKTIVIVVFVPLIMGIATFSIIIRKYSMEHFNKKIKPFFPAISAWGMVYIVFTSISINSQTIVGRPHLLLLALVVQVLFYAINYTIAVTAGRRLFNKKDSLTLVFSSVLRNLSISIGLAATAFGINAALMVSLAIIIQGQAAAWFIKLDERHHLLKD
jgi:ACR3 family arsenite transporter